MVQERLEFSLFDHVAAKQVFNIPCLGLTQSFDSLLNLLRKHELDEKFRAPHKAYS